jgi:hypothetical protein
MGAVDDLEENSLSGVVKDFYGGVTWTRHILGEKQPAL